MNREAWEAGRIALEALIGLEENNHREDVKDEEKRQSKEQAPESFPDPHRGRQEQSRQEHEVQIDHIGTITLPENRLALTAVHQGIRVDVTLRVDFNL